MEDVMNVMVHYANAEIVEIDEADLLNVLYCAKQYLADCPISPKGLDNVIATLAHLPKS